MDNPPKVRLVPVEPAQPIAVASVSGFDGTFPIFEFKEGCKYALSIDVGDLPPAEAMAHMRRLQEVLRDFFLPHDVMFIVARNGKPTTQIYEIHPVA